jgi:hypothetical protein
VRCERASELDPAAYLAEPGARRWAEFRGHYPACADCSLAVAGWSRLENALRTQADSPASAHPENALLARLAEEPASLPAEQKDPMEEHLAGCRTCSDKLAALRDFDFAAIAEAPRPSPGRALGDGLRSAGERLWRLLAGSSPESADALEDLLPWRRPELAFQSRPDGSGGTTGVPSPERGRPEALLAVVEGDLAGPVYPVFRGENRIGRARECDVQIASDALARVEATLAVTDGRFELTVAHERGALRVNGESVRSALLHDGDLLEIGGQRLRLRRVGAEGPESEEDAPLA